MELSRFDLAIIKRALSLLVQIGRDTPDEKIIQSTENAVTDILVEYPDTTIFEVTPNKLEE